MGRGLALVAITLVAAVAVAAAGAAPARRPPEVTLIGDSVATPIAWYDGPRRLMEAGLDLHVAVAICRALDGESCVDKGNQPPTLVELVPTLGADLGPTAVVVMGENDPEATFPAHVEAAVDALLAAGVKRILWSNIRAVNAQFERMDSVLDAAATRHPELTILNWSAYSGSHPDWFQSDGLHLSDAAGEQLAVFLHEGVMHALYGSIPLQVQPATLPPAEVGEPYRVRLKAIGGVAPYRWQTVSGPLPPGVHLLANGTIVGRPLNPLRERVVLAVADARGISATRRLQLRILP